MPSSVNPDAQAAYVNNLTNNVDQTRLGETLDNMGAGSGRPMQERDESPARSRLPNNDMINEDFDA